MVRLFMEKIDQVMKNLPKFHFDAEKMENSPLRQQVKLKEQNKTEQNLNSENKHSSNNIEFEQELNYGYKPINKSEFHRVANQLTLWNISNSGAVIKREGPTFVSMAVDITLQNLNIAKSPKAYFRGVLKNLQKCRYRECI